jgi:hypothetical protein
MNPQRFLLNTNREKQVKPKQRAFKFTNHEQEMILLEQQNGKLSNTAIADKYNANESVIRSCRSKFAKLATDPAKYRHVKPYSKTFSKGKPPKYPYKEHVFV